MQYSCYEVQNVDAEHAGKEVEQLGAIDSFAEAHIKSIIYDIE